MSDHSPKSLTAFSATFFSVSSAALTAILMMFSASSYAEADTSQATTATPQTSQSHLHGRVEPDLQSANTININTASVKQLMQLKGIGQSRAEEIIRYREQQGAFSSVDELILIKGIGSTTVERNRAILAID